MRKNPTTLVGAPAAKVSQRPKIAGDQPFKNKKECEDPFPSNDLKGIIFKLAQYFYLKSRSVAGNEVSQSELTPFDKPDLKNKPIVFEHLNNYVDWVLTRALLSENGHYTETIYTMLYLMHRYLKQVNRQLNLSIVRRLFLVSLLLATKFVDDYVYSNQHWVKFTDVPLQELKELELDLLFDTGFSLWLMPKERLALQRDVADTLKVGLSPELSGVQEEDDPDSPSARCALI